MFYEDTEQPKKENKISASSIQDRELREAAKQAETAFRENNCLPSIDKFPSIATARTEEDQAVIDKAKAVLVKHGIEPTEQNIVSVAEKIKTDKTASNVQKLKQFQYQTDKILVNQIFMLYPESTHLTIINNDRRDGENVPTITTHALRARFTDVTYSQGKRVLNRVNWEIFQNVICVVDNGIVNIKIINSNFDTKKEMFY
jgi:HPt (histidine-containing phosphotransfer) domain-containing protein